MIYLFFPILSLSCNDFCDPCLASSIKFLKNKCTNKINSTFSGGELGCSNCVNSYGSVISCDADQQLSPCALSESCGQAEYSALYGTLHIPAQNKSSICMWKLDLRGSVPASQLIQISYGKGQLGTLLLIGYLLPIGDSPSLNYLSNQIYIDTYSYNASKTLQFLSTNYIVIVFYTDNSDQLNADLTVFWNQNQDGYSSLTTILTVIALTLASIFCLACSCILVKKLYFNKIAIYSLNNQNYRSPSHNQETTVFNESEMQRMFPVEVLKEDLSQTNCVICFEGIPIGSCVRKLPCRHIFHSKCIEEWFLANAARPKCPLCKYSPVDNEPLEIPENQDMVVLDVN